MRSFKIMKIDNVWGELTDISAKAEALRGTIRIHTYVGYKRGVYVYSKGAFESVFTGWLQISNHI